MLEAVTYELNAVGRTPFACLVVILERDHEALERAQRREPGDEDERPPEHRVYPVRRLIEELNGECGARDDEARDEHGKERGRVRRIGEGEIESAPAAARREFQKAGKQLALAAARAPAFKPGEDGGRRSGCGRFGHGRGAQSMFQTHPIRTLRAGSNECILYPGDALGTRQVERPSDHQIWGSGLRISWGALIC
jgi:hypothetical protein